jgi:septal ring factor EnvC (AmiA/AmiB activator)
MQLEKVTSRSGHDTLAGWISSNDVTLFTTVLVLAIAMFLHASLGKRAQEKVQLTESNVALTQRLTATTGDRDTTLKLLDETRESLNRAQEERDQFQKELVDKLADIARLSAKLDLLLEQKGELETQRRSLLETSEALSKEKTQLLAQQSALAENRDLLKTSNADLLRQLNSIADQLVEKIAALEQVEAQRDRLKKQADELDAIVAGLKQRLDKLNIELDETRDLALATRAESDAKVQELEAELAARDKSAEEYLAKLRRATELFQGLTAEKEQLQQQLSEAELERQAELLEEGRNNRELVGLTGRLERVAVLFDASGSMRQAATIGGGDRWAESQQIAATWLQHLNVQQCVLIVFSSAVRTFPHDGSLADLRGNAGKMRREALLQHVKAVVPGGWTNTHDALAKAYEYDIDSILLFSDGAPTATDAGVFDPAVAEKIYDLCRAHPNIPIHTMGLGNYFDQNASTFLQTIAKITGGTFRGR